MVNLEVSLFISFAICTFIVVSCSVMKIRVLTDEQKSRVLVLAFGDLDRSPRMRAHTLSLCAQQKDVALCGYGKIPSPDRKLCAMLPIPHYVCPSWLPYIIQVPIKLLIFCMQSLFIVWHAPPLDAIIVQNPPTFPAVLVAWVCKWINGKEKCRLIIDMHNLGYTIAAMKLKALESPARMFERFCLRTFPDTVLVVSESFKSFLTDWGVESTVAYDRPNFSPPTQLDKDQLWEKLKEKYSLPEKPFILVSSTSWTPDEDFNILLKALPSVDVALGLAEKKMFLCITGKGPMKDAFMQGIEALALEHVIVKTMWLPLEEYPVMLSLADFGLSMHQSSSGIDLPMKIVDMFAVNTPVIARAFTALPELVEEGVNGYIFKDIASLSEVLIRAIGSTDRMREGVEKWRTRETWNEQWNRVVWPTIEPVFA